MDEYNIEDMLDDDETFMFAYEGPAGAVEVTNSYSDVCLFDPYGVAYQFARFLKAVGYNSDVQILVNGEEVLEK